MDSPVIIEDEERLLRAFRIASYEKISLTVLKRTFYLVRVLGGSERIRKRYPKIGCGASVTPACERSGRDRPRRASWTNYGLWLAEKMDHERSRSAETDQVRTGEEPDFDDDPFAP